jgi:hypothetical protein
MASIKVIVHAGLVSLSYLAAATAQADDAASRWLFGSQVGVAQGRGDSAPRAGDLSTLSYDVSATFGDKSRLGWRVFTGYRFTDYLAVHVGYTDLGKVEAGGSGQTVRGIDVGMQLKMPLSERVAVEFRGGKYYWQSRTHTESLWGDDYLPTRRDSDVFFGAGMEVAVLDELTATIGWTRYDVAGEPIALWTIGTLYRFSMN